MVMTRWLLTLFDGDIQKAGTWIVRTGGFHPIPPSILIFGKLFCLLLMKQQQSQIMGEQRSIMLIFHAMTPTKSHGGASNRSKAWLRIEFHGKRSTPWILDRISNPILFSGYKLMMISLCVSLVKKLNVLLLSSSPCLLWMLSFKYHVQTWGG